MGEFLMLWLRPVVLLMVAASLAGCGEEARRERPVTMVKTAVVHTQPRSTVIRLTGDVQARVSTELSFRVSGRVVERLVDVGAHVNAGDLLARLDPTEQRADLVGAQAALTAAEAQLRLATATYERQKTLMASGFTTRVAYDQAQEGCARPKVQSTPPRRNSASPRMRSATPSCAPAPPGSSPHAISRSVRSRSRRSRPTRSPKTAPATRCSTSMRQSS